MNRIAERVALLAAGAAIATSVFVVTAATSAYAAGGPYRVVQVKSESQVTEAMLNAQAAEGYSFVGGFLDRLIFKR